MRFLRFLQFVGGVLATAWREERERRQRLKMEEPLDWFIDRYLSGWREKESGVYIKELHTEGDSLVLSTKGNRWVIDLRPDHEYYLRGEGSGELREALTRLNAA